MGRALPIESTGATKKLSAPSTGRRNEIQRPSGLTWGARFVAGARRVCSGISSTGGADSGALEQPRIRAVSPVRTDRLDGMVSKVLEEESMTTYKVGYIVGSLSKDSINRILSKA